MNANDIDKAIDFYNQGNSMNATCRKFKTTNSTLKKIFINKNIYIRNQKEQLILENKKRAKQINHNYFSDLDYVKCYYLGFLAADGCIRKDRNEIKICLSSIDKDFLEEFKNNLNSETEIKTYITNNGFECCELRFSSLQIKLDLAQYCIVVNKTKKGITMKNIPENFKLAFIKGYFDGDGCIVVNNNTKQIKISFTSHTIGILEEIKNYFNNGNIYLTQNGNYSLEFSTFPSLNILQKFYDLNTPCLLRKYNKYLNALNIRNNIPRDKNSSVEDEKLC